MKQNKRFLSIFFTLTVITLSACTNTQRNDEMLNKPKPKLLKLVPYSDPILRKKTQVVSFPLSEEDRQIIADMKYSIQPAQLNAAGAPWDGASGMAANQWGINKSIFLYCPTGDSVNQLTVAINPSYEYVDDSEEHEWEGCFSVPLSTGNVKRRSKIKSKYQNEDGEFIERELSGWAARVWQHETDHLNGFLYDDHFAGKCVEKKVFESREDVDKFYDGVREERRKRK